jgi:hypothetical protein
MLNPVTGQYMDVNRSENIVIPNIEQARTRQVHLPGIPQPVICVPAPLKFETGDINISTKAAGRYTGAITIFFTRQF